MICAYLDDLDGSPVLAHPPGDAGWESRRLEALARSLLDGLCVWGRELYRPADERSPTIIEHERQRSRRMADIWETEIDNPHLRGRLNMAQITLVCALQLEARAIRRSDGGRVTRSYRNGSTRSARVRRSPRPRHPQYQVDRALAGFGPVCRARRRAWKNGPPRGGGPSAGSHGEHNWENQHASLWLTKMVNKSLTNPY